MAKKLVSLLCAVAMLVTMVSIAAFSASAAPEGYADFRPLSEANVSFVEKSSNKYYGLFNTTYFGEYFYPFQTTGTAAFPAYQIDNEFEFSFDFGYGYHAGTPDEMHVEIALGQLLIVINSTGNNPFSQVVAKYNGTQIGDTVVTGWKQYVAPTDDEKALLAQEINTALNSTKVTTKMAVGYVQKFTCAFDGTTLTITMGKAGSGKTITGTIANADFSNAAMTITSKEDGYRAAAIGNFSGTYKPLSTTSAPSVTFNANGGSCAVNKATVNAEGKLDTLPEATMNAYAFDGWFTAAEGGDPITTDTVFTEDTTVYAHWTALPLFGNFTADNTVAVDFGGNATVDYPDYTASFNSANFGNALVVETWRSTNGVAAVSTLGNFTMSKFSTEFSLYFRNETVADKNHVELQFGGLVVTISKSADGYAYNVSASYNGSDLTLSNTATVYNNIEAEIKDNTAGALPKTELRDEMVAAIGAEKEISASNIGYFPAAKISFRVSYENGTLTIETVNSKAATFTATAAVPEASFSNAEVKVTLFSKSTCLILGNWDSSYDGTVAEPVHGANLVIGESVTPVFMFKEAALGGNAAGDLTATVSVAGKDYAGLALVQDGTIYKVACGFITPDTFGSTITVKLVKTADGSEVDSLTYSVRTYCENTFASGSDYLKALLRDILVYGESTRQYLLANDSANLDGHTVPTEAIALIDGMAGLPATTYPAEVTAAAISDLAGFGLNLTGKVSLYVMPKNDAFDTVVSSYGTVDKIVNTHYVSVSFLDAATPITLTLYKDSAEVGSLELSVGSVIKAYSNAYSGNAVMMNLLDCMAKVAASSYAYNASLGA